ncbi:MAG: SusC/RagA family TonB-linked outer membrane protein [Candidatus Cryptobacteroides sp.]
MQAKHLVRIAMTVILLNLCTAFGASAQEQTVTINKSGVTLKEVLTDIERQTTYRFSYRHSVIGDAKDITLKKRNVTVTSVLDEILPPRKLEYTVVSDKMIVITDSKTSSTGSSQNTRRVTGTVKDIHGEPVTGAYVQEVGSKTNGATTGLDGEFELSIAQSSMLQVSFVGFLSKVIDPEGKNSLTIILEEDSELLDEVVVIGYGTRQKKNIIGSVDKIGAEMVEGRPVGNAMAALQGTSANLVIQTKSMNPNNPSTNINIRGISTVTNNDPLVIIDGVTTDLNSLNRINPDDIASISVLKDAGSAAIYGSRAASGVLLVTTKAGSKSSKPVVKVNAMVGANAPQFFFEPVKGYENAILRNQARINVGSAPEFTPDQIRDIAAHKDQKYLLFQILQPALQQKYTASISGGTEHSTYLVSAGYYDQDSNYIGGNYDLKRYNFRINNTTEYGRFKLTAVLSYNRTDSKAPNATNAIQNATRWPVYYYNTMVDDRGRYVAERTSQGILEAGGFNKREEDNVIGNLTGELKIVDGLKARAVLGLDLTSTHRLTRQKSFPYYVSSEAENPAGWVNADRKTTDYNERHHLLSSQFILDYDKTFAEKHNVTALVGVSNESYTSIANQIVTKYTDPDLGTPSSDGLTEYDPSSYNSPSGTLKTSIYSVFGRAGYSYDDRYYGEFSFRYDGSSKFAQNHRWGFFPSVSAGWRLSHEKFMRTYREKVGSLKLRASYGLLGNQNVGNYKYLTTYSVNENAYGFNNSAVSGTSFSFGNPELTWEKTAILNVGLDAGFLKDKLTVSFDWFRQTTYDILIPPEVPDLFGGSVATENTGKMQNQGWELAINYRFSTGPCSHFINFNIGDSKNKVVDFDEERINDAQQMSTIIKEGYALNSYYGLKVAGYFKDEEDIMNSALPAGAIVAPGDVKYEDYDHNGIIDDNDRQILGNAFPRYTYGIKYSFDWKGLDFGFFIQGVGKRDMILRGEMVIPFASDFTTTMFKHQLDYWTPENTDARWPRLTANGSASNQNNYWKTSDIFLLNAAYLRLKDLQIGYTLPKSVSRKIGLNKLRIYANAENLLTWTATKFYNPESSEFGNNMGGLSGATANSGREYPMLRYFGGGLNIEF